MMDKLAICRMCLRVNVRMSVIVDNNMQELYEKLTDVPFVTDDSRPLLACFFCFAKLKQCYQLQRQCLEAEQLLNQMINEPHILMNRCQPEFFNAFTRTPMENINIVDVVQLESIVKKEELPAVSERLDYTIEVKVDIPSEDLELKNKDNNHSNVEATPLKHSETDLDGVHSVKYVTEVAEGQEASQKKLRISDTKITLTNRPSYAQLQCLVKFLEQNPGIAKGLLRTTPGKFETKKKWANMAITLNSLGGINKTGQGWAKYWAEKKCGLKMKASMRCTGGGTADNLPALSALDNRFMAVMGAQEFATGDGDSRWTVSPSPQSTKPTESPVDIEDVLTVQEDMEMDSSQDISSIPVTSHITAIPAPSTSIPPPPTLQNTIPPRRRRRRSLIPRPLNTNMEQFASIEARRVDAELITAQAFTQLSKHIGSIASALTCIANAISAVAKKMPN